MVKLKTLRRIYYRSFGKLEDFYYEIKAIPFKIKRACQFAKKSWWLRDYDFTSTLDMMEFTLSRLAVYIKNSNSVYADKRFKEIRILIEYTRRVNQKTDALEHLNEYLEKKYPDKPDWLDDINMKGPWFQKNPTYVTDLLNKLKKEDELQKEYLFQLGERIKNIERYRD